MARRYVFGILTLLVSGLIVFTSLNTGATYASAGGRIGAFVNAVFFGGRLNAVEVSALTGFGGKFFGHFSLFALDGVFAYFFCRSFPEKKKAFTTIFIVFGLLMSVAGEVIQIFIEGRGPSFVDVIIDFSGYSLIPTVITLYRRFNRL